MKKNKENSTDYLLKSILKVFRDAPSQNFNHKQVSSRLPNDLDFTPRRLQSAIEKLVKDKFLKEVDRGKYKFVAPSRIHEGKLDLIKSGSGYVTCEDIEEDVYISSALSRP